MESEKVKEIKKGLEQNIRSGLGYEDNDKFCNIMFADILTLINELESENERLILQYERGQADSEMNCLELKDRIAELEKETVLCDGTNLEHTQEDIEAEKGCNECIRNHLKQFAERLKDRLRYTSPTSDVLELSGLEFDGIEVEQCIDETLKEFINGL